jgi:hypothetical protein
LDDIRIKKCDKTMTQQNEIMMGEGCIKLEKKTRKAGGKWYVSFLW